MANRGEFTDNIKSKMEAFMGRPVDRTEFRLLPYIQYVMVNDQRIDISKVNAAERNIMSEWRKAGHIEGGASGMAITEEFWAFLCEIVFLGYVAYREAE